MVKKTKGNHRIFRMTNKTLKNKKSKSKRKRTSKYFFGGDTSVKVKELILTFKNTSMINHLQMPIYANITKIVITPGIFLDVRKINYLPPALIHLEYDDNNIDITVELPQTLQYFSCDYSGLTDIPLLPNSLTYLSCNGNALITLPHDLPLSLITLLCNDNKLTELPIIPQTVTQLGCSYNQISALPSTLPSGLIYLTCSNNLLNVLPMLPDGIQRLAFKYNKIQNVDKLPSELIELVCDNNELVALPAPLPIKLNYLSANSNQLTALPDMPANITRISVNNNKLTTLPSMPQSVIYLSCANNDIDISALPPGFEQIATFIHDMVTTPINVSSSAKGFNVITQEEFNVKEYLQQPDNIVFALQTTSNENNYYLSSKTDILSVMKDPTAILYECLNATGSVSEQNAPRNSDDLILFPLNRIGVPNDLVYAKELLPIITTASSSHILTMTSLKTIASTVSQNVLNGAENSYIGGRHCQEGQGGTIYSIQYRKPIYGSAEEVPEPMDIDAAAAATDATAATAAPAAVVTVQVGTNKHTFPVEDETSVEDIKNLLLSVIPMEVPAGKKINIRLIYMGKILKDEQIVSTLPGDANKTFMSTVNLTGGGKTRKRRKQRKQR